MDLVLSPPNIFRGIQGIGVAEAWYATSFDVEWAIVSRTPLIGGTLDQILRPLLYAVLRIAGIPTQVLTAYISYQEHILIYHRFHGSLGQPH